MKPINLITIIVTFILLFWFSLQPAIDPDTGWHIATGRFILEHHRLPLTDPFSFSLPNLPYIAHSWGTDVVMYLIDRSAGPVGLSVLFALLTTAFFALTYTTLQNLASNIPASPLGGHNPLWLIPLAYPVIEIIGQRPQVITVIGLAGLLNLLNREITPKFTWQLPLLFLIWANLHGGVILGLTVFGLWLGLSLVLKTRNQNNLKLLSKCLLLSFGAVLVNPYTYHLFTFALGMITNSVSMIYNSDWVPLFSGRLGDDSLILRLTIVAGSLVAIIDQKKQPVLRALAIIFLALAFKSLRYLVPLLPVIILLVVPMLEQLFSSFIKYKWFIPAAVLLVLSFSFSVLGNKSDLFCSRHPDCYARLAQMPRGAVSYLKDNRLSGRIFNFYTWGGYLTWQLPDSRIFIDGRMDNFFIGNTSFLTEFVAIEELQQNWYDRLMGYRPDLAIIPPGWQEQVEVMIDRGWQELYRDNLSVLLAGPSSFHSNTK